MDQHQYKPVSTAEEDETHKDKLKTPWTPFLRQLLICSGLWTTYFVTGLSLGAPTVAIPQFRREGNSTATVSDEMASWLSSALPFSTLPWVVVLPAVSRYIGRRLPFFFAFITSIASLIVFYIGKTPIHFLISQIIQGILFGSNLTVSIIMVTEYTSPQYRGLFLTIKSASIFWGMWVSNAIGTFFHWNYIGLFGLICSAYYITFAFWPESPYWLASKGKFNECTIAHRWLKGVDNRSEKELERLIILQKEYLKGNNEGKNLHARLRSFVKAVSCTEFYQPILISVLVIAQYHASGKVVCMMYSIELIKKITESESTAYMGMLLLDGLSVFGMYFGCALSKFLRRRTLLLSSSAIAIFFLFTMSLYLWLVQTSIVTENNIISISLLAAFSFAISCGPMVLSTSIYGELIPLRFKSSAVIITILMHFIFLGTGIKIAPFIFRSLSLYGTFSLYGVLASILSVVLYKYLPETKDKTLQEIEEYFKDTSKVQEPQY